MFKTIFLIPFIFLVSLQIQAQDSTIPAEVVEVRSFGIWETSEQIGHYRIVIKQYGYEHVKNTVFIQWIAESEEGNTLIKSVPISEVNEPNVYAVGIEKINGDKISLNLTDTYTLDNTSIEISVGSPGKYKASAV
ncbi:MAG: hypothetical protein WD511_01020 [Balneolaceae bacterium]